MPRIQEQVLQLLLCSHANNAFRPIAERGALRICLLFITQVRGPRWRLQFPPPETLFFMASASLPPPAICVRQAEILLFFSVFRHIFSFRPSSWQSCNNVAKGREHRKKQRGIRYVNCPTSLSVKALIDDSASLVPQG